ncbi:hypothetical protein RB195_025724 [Necator americanus]|uniref:EGF-like domain protein n=1 Tax=Necator americanus TaxID=51031 RepID=A0ABR1ETL1_NECAM
MRRLLLALMLSVVVVQLGFACPIRCSCSTNTVICTGLNLTKIPSGIPFGTHRLDLQENRIAVIRRDDLRHLKQLKILQLMDNHIHSIEEGAFSELEALERLRLNRNRLRLLPDKIFAENKNLHRLDLSENFLTAITDDQLQGPKSMHNLQLDRNSLVCLETSVISTWNSLEIFTLNGNNLTTLGEIEMMPNLRLFRLGENPWHCDCRLKWMKRTLSGQSASLVKCMRPAFLQGRTMDLLDESLMKCSGIEKRATVSCADAHVCPPACTCTDTTVDCRDRGLTHIPANLPSSTTELRLEQNQITYVPPKAFQNLRNLKRLDLSKNNIVEVAPRAFQGLHTLNSLVLYGNNLTELPAEAFDGLKSLQLLLLNANQLQCIRRGTFDPLTELNLLSLYDNQIRSISNETFHKLSKLQTLHLAKNPLICDCNLEWLAELQEARNIETSGARCEAPKRVSRKRFAALPPSKFRCKGTEIYQTQRADECFIDVDCPAQCTCHGTVVDCSNKGLIEVPHEIPQFTTELYLTRNRISVISAASGLSKLQNLLKLDISSNNIVAIEEGSLTDMKSLRDLNLSHNKLRHFYSAVLGTSNVIEVLSLGSNLLQCLAPSTIGNLTQLRFISLSNNQLKCITPNTFDGLKHLRTLQISGNDLPCDCQVLPLVEWMRANTTRTVEAGQCTRPAEMLGKNLEDLTKDDMKCSGEIVESACAGNGDYCPASCTCQDTIVRCSNKELTAFPSAIPVDTTELFLDSNVIDEIPIDQISRLSNLVKLDMSHNRVESIEDGTFANLTKLSTLILSYNKLRCLQPHSFAGLRSLRILSLHGNDISLLPETAFESLGNITHIAVGSNSLYCDCRMEWFSRWIKSKFVEAGIARCVAPPNVANQLLLTARSNQFQCAGVVPTSVSAKCDACVMSPCKNGARCETTSGRSYRCHCAAGFHGKDCELEIDACYGHPCLNNAVCKVIQEGRFTCVCPKGFKGDYCEVNIDDCEKNKCQNGAKCIDMINSYRCECGPMYGGKYCEEKLEFCSKRLNPCENGSKCHRKGADYMCECLPGFTDRNCSTNIDDCGDHLCKNGGICVDGITTYSCQCVMGFSGQFCEIPPMGNALYPNTAQCHSLLCGHGSCYTNEDMSEYECKCHEGYTGDKCDKIRSIGLHHPAAYAALEPWAVANGNLTFTIRTSNESGLIAYYGDDNFISVELYDGRIKIAFYIGNYPASHMYSYVTVNDGMAHRIEILVKGKKCSLSIDNQTLQSVENDGKLEKFSLDTKQYLYIGGLPVDKATRVKSLFHVKETHSFKGCISDVFVNDVAVDFENAIEKERITPGCAGVVDLCTGVDCGRGSCEVNLTSSRGYSCRCEQGFSGDFCQKRVITCNKEKFRRYHEDGDCRSVDMVKNAECVGYCGEGESCCAAVKTKRRKLRMTCRNGQIKHTMITIVRKCQCSNTCRARTYRSLMTRR